MRSRIDPQTPFVAGEYVMSPTPPTGRRAEPSRGKMNETKASSRTDKAMLGRLFENSFSRDLEADAGLISSVEPSAAGHTRGAIADDAAKSVLQIPVRGPLSLESMSSGRENGENRIGLCTDVGRTSLSSNTCVSQAETSLVTVTDDPRRSLEVDLRPTFEEHRGTWGRMMDAIAESRHSWRLSIGKNTEDM